MYNQDRYQEATMAYDQSLKAMYDVECIVQKANIQMMTNHIDEARTLYQQAMQQDTDHKPMLKARILSQYGTLLLHHFKDIKAAQVLFQQSLQINRNNPKAQDMYNYCVQCIENEKQTKIKQHSMDRSHVKNIRLIVYKFEDIVFHNKMEISSDMSWKDIKELFGGEDRIGALRNHFQRMHGIKKLKLGLVTEHHEKVIVDLLSRTRLKGVFEDSIYSLHTDWDPIDNGLSKKNRCYVAMNSNQEDTVREYCMILYMKPYEECCLSGLKLIDMFNIESTFNLCMEGANWYYSIYDVPFAIPDSMMQHDAKVYNAIKTEIETMCTNVEHLQVFDWINKHFREYTECYKEFCYKFGDCYFAMKERSYWTAANFLFSLMIMEQNDSELHGKYAKCLGQLGLELEANAHFEQSLQLKNDSYSVHESYGEFLHNCRRHHEAITQFHICLDLKKFEGPITKHTFYTNYAKSLDFGQFEDTSETEKYYKLAIEYCNKKNIRGIARCHGDFAAFLKKLKRFKEAREEYEIALRLDGGNFFLHWKLSNVLFAMGLAEEHTEPLIRALQIKPTFEPALRDYQRYYNRPYGGDEWKEDIDPDQLIQDVRNLNMNRNCNTNARNSCESIQNAETYETASNYQSATSTSLSRWHPSNKWQHEFNRMYWKKFKGENETDKARFTGYLNEMAFASFNNIRMVIKHDAAALNKQIKMHIKIARDHMTEDLRKMAELFEEMKNEWGLFIEFCNANDIDRECREEVLEKNGVFSVCAMRLIKSKQDLMLMISNAELKSQTRNDKTLTDDIWSLIQQINN